MRELKYKAYNKRSKDVEIITDLYWFEENCVNKNGDYDWVLLEYTGLNDKNGVEIYEGDVLRVDDCYQQSFIVEYSPPCFVLSDANGGFLADESFTWEEWEKSEVVGNIHQ